MTKSRFLTIVVVILLLLNGFLIASMVMHNRGVHRKHNPKLKIIKALNFDEGQIAKYQIMVDSHSSEVKGLNQKIAEKKRDLYLTLKNVENTQKEKNILNELDSLQSYTEELHLKHFKEIKAICKNEQQLQNFNRLADEIQEMFSIPKNRP